MGKFVRPLVPGTTPLGCWEVLKQGNENWSKRRRSAETAASRNAVQSPFAVVLACSDSRVPPEVVFDRGIGDLFVIRVAGNVLDKHVTGSIQFAVQVQEFTKLIVVLGHQGCGAVEAAVQGLKLPEPLATLVNALRPAVEASRHWPGDPVENAVDANIHLTTKQLTDLFQKDGAVVLGKRYSPDTGEISDPQPWKP